MLVGRNRSPARQDFQLSYKGYKGYNKGYKVGNSRWICKGEHKTTMAVAIATVFSNSL